MSQLDPQQPRPFRWRIIGVLLCSIIGVLSILSTLVTIAGMIYVNMKYGWVEYSDGRNETRDQVAVTTMNVVRPIASLILGIVWCIAAREWHKQRRKTGLLYTVIAYGLTGIFYNYFSPP